MIIDSDIYTDTLIRLKIDPEQYFLCHLLYADRRIQDGSGISRFPYKGSTTANIYKYAEGVKKWSTDKIEDLEEKGLITKASSPSGYKDSPFPDMYQVTDKFVEVVMAGGTEFEEFWATYPTYVPNFRNPRGPKINLRVCDKDKLANSYRAKVVSKSKHDFVLDMLKWGLEKDLVKMNIENFMNSEMWEAIYMEYQKSSSLGSKGNMVVK